MQGEGVPRIPWSFLALTPELSAPSSSRSVVLPVPYDSTASYRGGARDGPRAIIEASRFLEDYDLELGCEPSALGIHTAPEVEPHVGSPQAMVERVRCAVLEYASSGQVVGLVGGEHSVSIGAVQAFQSLHPRLSVLYLDAHADLRDEYQGARYSHASTARRVHEAAPLVQVGIRSLSQEEHRYIRQKGVHTFFREGSNYRPLDTQAVVALLSPEVYISVDLDVFDPSLMAAVGTPEPGGLSWEEVVGLLRAVGEARRIVGFDVVELSPGEGPSGCAFVAARLAYKLIGYATCLRMGEGKKP